MSKKRQSHLRPASEVLQSLLQNGKSPLGQQFTRWKLWKNWSQVVGEEMAKYTRPVGYERGRIYIWVNHSTRLQEMTFLLNPLRKKINDYVGSKWVHSIRFTLDGKDVPESAVDLDHSLF